MLQRGSAIYLKKKKTVYNEEHFLPTTQKS